MSYFNSNYSFGCFFGQSSAGRWLQSMDACSCVSKKQKPMPENRLQRHGRRLSAVSLSAICNIWHYTSNMSERPAPPFFTYTFTLSIFLGALTIHISGLSYFAPPGVLFSLSLSLSLSLSSFSIFECRKDVEPSVVRP